MYRCNGKYSKTHDKCETLSLSEETIKEKFIRAYNLVMADKQRIIDDVDAVIKMLADTTELDSLILEFQSKMEVISGLVEKMVRENATTAKDQEEFKKKYDELKSQYDGLKDSLDKAISDKAYNQAQEIKKAETYLPEWFDEIRMMVESGTVNRDGTITFRFTSGTEITL